MKKRWDRAAMRFASATYVDRQAMLDVTFENGDRFLVAAESVLPQGDTIPAWCEMRVIETGDVLEVPTLDDVIEIPWDRIRALADPDFRAHLADKADERAHCRGKRIRAMRLEAGLTPGALAEKVGVSREVVAELEGGKIEPSMDLIEHIALALGKRLRDFADE